MRRLWIAAVSGLAIAAATLPGCPCGTDGLFSTSSSSSSSTSSSSGTAGASASSSSGTGGVGGAGGMATGGTAGHGGGGAPPDAGDAGDGDAALEAGFADAAADGGPCPTWAGDVWPLLDNTTAACTATGLCHGSGKGGLQLTAGDPAGSLAALRLFTLAASPGPAKQAIVPGDPAASGLPCNMKTDTGVTNPYGTCGSGMPVVGTNLTAAEIQTIADWIACGALD